MHFHPKQRLAIGLLAAGCRSAATAAACGLDRRTLYHWRQEPAFAAAVQQCLQTELRQQRERYVAESVANKKALLAASAARLAGLRSTKATISQQRESAGAVLRATLHLVNLNIHNQLPVSSYEKW